MRRRVVLAGAAGLAATAGCLSRPDDDSHPFDGDSLTVRVDENTATPHDLNETTREALAFWETNSETYAGFTVGFELVETGEADLVVAYADSPRGCSDVEGDSERVLGCAPVLGPDTSVPKPTVARVVAGSRPVGQILITTKHEIGHVLGLTHADEPREVMSSRPEDRLRLYDRRVEIRETTVAGAEQTSAANSVYGDAIDRWNGGDYGGAAPAFEQARQAYADAVEQFESARARTDEFERTQTETVDLERVRALLEGYAEQVGLLVSAAETMSEAADAAAAGDTETANARRDRANDRIDAFRAEGSLRVRDVAVALGLVRESDREQPVGGPGETEP
jgi:hypothetical protein